MQYTPQAGPITVQARRAGPGGGEVTVAGTGCGIGPDELPHVFERYYKEDQSRGKGGESGLGLYIVRSNSEGMGGSVRAESTPGAGAAISFLLKAR